MVHLTMFSISCLISISDLPLYHSIIYLQELYDLVIFCVIPTSTSKNYGIWLGNILCFLYESESISPPSIQAICMAVSSAVAVHDLPLLSFAHLLSVMFPCSGHGICLACVNRYLDLFERSPRMHPIVFK